MDWRSLADACMTRADLLANCSSSPDGLLLRTCLSPEMADAHALVRGWMEAVGQRVEVDSVGNILGHSHPERARRLVIGSHLDTVRDAGKYDGMLGVLMGLALAETGALAEGDVGLTVVGFSDEEGVRFGVPFLGSRGLLGTVPEEWLQVTDDAGTTMEEAMRSFGGTPPTLRPENLVGFLEPHIEQGPVLEDAGLAVGVVTGIVGQSWAEVRFSGLAGHAGTTPMALRHDALLVAAKYIQAVDGRARGTEGLVATCGCVECHPGSTNVIPGEVRVTVDARHLSAEVLDGALQGLEEDAVRLASESGCHASFEVKMKEPPAPFAPEFGAALSRAIEAEGLKALQLVSGAGHDARMFAGQVPTTMLFLRTPKGLSHHPDEAVMPEDIALGLKILDRFLRDLPV